MFSLLPRTMRVAEINGLTRFLRDLRMTRHFPILIVSMLFRAANGTRSKAAPKPSTAGLGIAHFYQHQIAAGALDQRAHRRAVIFALDRIGYPVARLQTVFNLR